MFGSTYTKRDVMVKTDKKIDSSKLQKLLFNKYEDLRKEKTAILNKIDEKLNPLREFERLQIEKGPKITSQSEDLSTTTSVSGEKTVGVKEIQSGEKTVGVEEIQSGEKTVDEKEIQTKVLSASKPKINAKEIELLDAKVNFLTKLVNLLYDLFLEKSDSGKDFALLCKEYIFNIEKNIENAKKCKYKTSYDPIYVEENIIEFRAQKNLLETLLEQAQVTKPHTISDKQIHATKPRKI